MIYLDHAAATPVSPKVVRAMEPYFADQFYNPSSPYLPAKRVREVYEDAKNQIAHCIGAKGTDLVITAGATEATNLAFTVIEKTDGRVCAGDFDVYDDRVKKDRPFLCDDRETPVRAHEQTLPSVLTLATEHASVRATAARHGAAEIAVLPDGTIDLADFKRQLTHDIQLVSVSLANNELGTIQPIADISAIIRAERAKRLEQGIKAPIYFHTDASQALNLLDINVARLGVDLMTLNAAKVYGPKGVGALYVAHGVELQPVTVGGGQERGLRSGTENVPGVVGFATALTDAKSHLASNRKKYTEFSKLFIAEIEKAGFGAVSQVATENEAAAAREDGPAERRAPKTAFSISARHKLANFLTLIFPGLDAERLIYKLESQGVLVSTGAACAASKGEKSHVLTAIGLTDDEIAGSLRITFGATNTREQVTEAARLIAAAATAEYARLASK